MNTQDQQQPAIATPSLPKGGGAIQSIGKGWGAVGSSGAASLEIALPITPGRGYAPGLSLNYQSTVGNGPFGLGWNLSLGCVARRASKGVPTYTDDDVILGPSGDVWLPARDANGAIEFTEVSTYNGLGLGATYQVVRYFARVEGAFDLIEHWRLDIIDPGFWLVHGADGSLHLYGKKISSRNTDPADANRVAEWLLEESMNARGEHILYEYKREDQTGLLEDHPPDFSARRYLRRVRYGNFLAHPLLYLWDETSVDGLQWHFDLLFDYGERDVTQEGKPHYEEEEQDIWPVRSDPHSSFVYGFELRTLRLCRQVLMFHYFPVELGPDPVLINRLLLEYTEHELKYNTLSAVHAQAYDADGRQEKRPPVIFNVRAFDVKKGVFTPFEALPGLNDGEQYQMVDLYGDGLPGVLYRNDKSWLYREPLRASTGGDHVAYGPWQELPRIPVADSQAPVRQTLTDLTGDGHLDWIVAQPGMAGFFTLRPDRSWSNFATFGAFPLEFFHPLGQMADLIGGGLSDLALIGPRSVRLYANRRAEGFAPGIDVAHDEDDADRLPLLSDSPNELVAFSDLLGTGQQHLIRIRHDRVMLWPNLGHGHFGKGQVFAELPFEYGEFDASRVRLADMDGSGASDLIYLEADHFQIFMNQGGNTFADPAPQAWPPDVRYDRFCQVSTADLQGLGCSSLVLTIPHMTPRHWRFDFPQIKPYLLASTNNNMGASGSVTYRSSAQEWLDEKQALLAADKVAVSELPFPVHVVVKQIQKDEITTNSLTQSFQYRQGFYDRHEREFRGFGLLLQTDTEPPLAPEEGFTAPVLSKTWFHTGRYPERLHDDYNTSDPDAQPLGEHLLSRYDNASQTEHLITDADDATHIEMARALSGSVLRVEVFGLDGNQAQSVPYSVQASRYLVRLLQPLGPHQPYALMLPLALESISYAYERLADDPMCEHSVNLTWDAYGSLTHGVTVNHARRKQASSPPPPFDYPHQQSWWQVAHDDAQQSFYINEVRAQAIHLDQPQSWLLGLPYRARGNAMIVPASALAPSDISYEQFSDPAGKLATLPRTLVSLSVQRYIDSGEGEATFQALPDAQESAELDEHALGAYERVMNAGELAEKLAEVGYQQMPGFLPEDALNLWSVKRGFATYAGAEDFYRINTFRPTRSHGWTTVEYDAYNLLVIRVTDPVGCATTATYDYRTLQPWQIVDPNQNTQEAAFDAFGMLHATTFYGTELGEEVGFDPIVEYHRYIGTPSDAMLRGAENVLGRMGSVYYYDPFSWKDRNEPVHSAVFQADRYPDDPDKQIRISLTSVDGFARTLQTRQLVEDGDAYSVDPFGNIELEFGTPPVPKIVHASPRWRVSERVEYNNKGLAVRVYRPFFANSFLYVKDLGLRKYGYCDKQFYDPLGRPTITTTAKGWMRRQTYLTWYTISEDENDTAEEVLAAKSAEDKSQ